VLCWNIRGLNAKTKQLALLNAIKLSGCAIVCLQETKKSHFDLAFIKSCCPNDFDEFVYVPSNGASGGLIIIWKSSVFSGMIMHCEPFALSVYFTSKQDNFSWTLLNIYGPCSGDLRDDFVNWFYNLNIPDEEDWLICGDFNFIRSIDNRNKPGGDVDDMLLFNDLIRSQNLTEIPIKGRSFTWSNMQLDPLLEQLDWFFTSLHWSISYPNTVVNPQGKPTSDHTPCVASIQTSIPACKLFRFESFWTAQWFFADCCH
jgi:exonuclease III